MKSAPFIHTEKNTPYIYLTLVIALFPCAILGIFNYGLKALILLMMNITVFVSSERIFEKNIRREQLYYDLSSVFYAVLLTLLLPPVVPFYVSLIASLFGAVVIRELSGGIGNSPINPAVASRVFIELLIPSETLGGEVPGANWFGLGSLIYGSSSRLSFDLSDYSYQEIFFGRYPSYIGTASILFILLGFLYLCFKKTVRFYAPIGFLSVVIAGMFILDIRDGFKEFAFDLMSTGTLFAAAFLYTDPVTVPSNSRGALPAGVVSGMVLLLLLQKANPAMSICISVLVCNMCVFSFEYFASLHSRKGAEKGGDAS